MMNSDSPPQRRQTWRKALQFVGFTVVVLAVVYGAGIPNLWHSFLASRQLQNAASLSEQLQAFARIQQNCRNYEVRLFDESGDEFLPFSEQDSNRIFEVEIRFADGGVIRTQLKEPGKFGLLLQDW